MTIEQASPVGHEDPLREFAAFYRALPTGRYETVSHREGVYVRKRKGPYEGSRIYYVVNTSRHEVTAAVELKATRAVDLVTGEVLDVLAGRLAVPLRAAQMRGFRIGTER